LDVEVGGFESYPTKDWRDSEGEAIGQVAGGVSHGEVREREKRKREKAAEEVELTFYPFGVWPLTCGD
jgi:hypothetical protein